MDFHCKNSRNQPSAYHNDDQRHAPLVKDSRQAEFKEMLDAFRDNNCLELDYEKCFVGSTKILWRYTTGTDLLKIWKSGLLSPSNAGFLGAMPVLWFCDEQEWAPTVQNKIELAPMSEVVTLSREEVMHENLGLVRLGYPADGLFSWDDTVRLADFSDEQIERLKQFARAQGSSAKTWMGYGGKIALWDLMVEVWDEDYGFWECVNDPSASASEVWISAMKAAA